MRCPYCNWRSHDVSEHPGPRCRNGHPLDVVGKDASGRCRQCHRDRARARAEQDRERERERCRAYHWAHRDAIIARKRAKRGGVPTEPRRGHRGAGGQPPPSAHPWRATNPKRRLGGRGD